MRASSFCASPSGAQVAWGLCVASVALIAPGARAAQITDVADAVDHYTIGSYVHDDAFDLYVGAAFGMIIENGKITREPIDRGGVSSANCSESNPRNCLPVDELAWNRTTNVLRLALEVGLFHDLALTFGWTYVLSQDLQFAYADRVSATNSSVDSNFDINRDGQVDDADRLFAHNYASKRAGSGPLEIGVRWAPLSDERDGSKPTWVLAFNWETPWTTTLYDPGNRSANGPWPVGEGVHRLTFSTALSKRVANFGLVGIDPNVNRRGFLDPYFALSYTLPLSNRQSLAANRTNTEFGASPSHVGTIRGGVEIVPLEDLKKSRKVAIDVGLIGKYFSEGRNYSELTDPLGELTYTEQYMNLSGLLGFYVQAAEFVRLQAGITLGYTTEHFLTNEEVGEDKNGDRQVVRPEDDVNNDTKDALNPYFCGNVAGDTCSAVSEGGRGQPPYDQVGFRFKDEAHMVFSWFVSLLFTF